MKSVQDTVAVPATLIRTGGKCAGIVLLVGRYLRNKGLCSILYTQLCVRGSKNVNNYLNVFTAEDT